MAKIIRVLSILFLLLPLFISTPRAALAANYEVNSVLTDLGGNPVTSMTIGNYYYVKSTVINNTAASKIMVVTVELSDNVFHISQSAPVSLSCSPFFSSPYGMGCQLTVPAHTQYVVSFFIRPGQFESWGGSADPIVTTLIVDGIGTVETENDVFNSYGENGVLLAEVTYDWQPDSVNGLGTLIYHDNLDYTMSTQIHLAYCDTGDCVRTGAFFFQVGPGFVPKVVNGVLQAKFYKSANQPQYGYVGCTLPQPTLIKCSVTNWDWGQWTDPQLVATSHSVDRTGKGALQTGMWFYYENLNHEREFMWWKVYEIWP